MTILGWVIIIGYIVGCVSTHAIYTLSSRYQVEDKELLALPAMVAYERNGVTRVGSHVTVGKEQPLAIGFRPSGE